MDTIMTWDSFFKDSPLTRHARLSKEAAKRGTPLPGEILVADLTLPAIANAGRWGVLCPWCAGAEFAREDGLFMCQSCWNAGVQRKYVRVSFPANRGGIEAVLVKRIDPQTRNWTNETIEVLLAENAAHMEAT
jgi:hypothetical protein